MSAPRLWASAGVVFLKELRDALRDRRTLMMVVLSSVAIGPLLLVALSVLVGDVERRAEQRLIVVAGMAHGPTLVNYLRRQTFQIEPAPADYERRLRQRTLLDPVLVLPEGFEPDLRRGDPPSVEVVSSSDNPRAAASVSRLVAALQGFNSEQATLRLAVRGISPALLGAVEVQERDLASAQSRAAQLTAMLPFFVLMAVLYGALNAALDTTAGERERGSLEPLLMNPAPRLALVMGKWGAVTSVGMLIALLSCASFLPAQALLGSETLAAMFRFGPYEAALFLALLAPLAAGLSALLMAVAIRCRTFKEAQANSTLIVLAVSLLPLLTIFNRSGEPPWQIWVPALGQVTLMNRVLRGEAIGVGDLGAALLVCGVLTVAGLGYLARQLRSAAAR